MTTDNERRRRIRQIQSRLKAAGLYRGQIDGSWGPLTAAALAESDARQAAQPRTRPPALRETAVLRALAHIFFTTAKGTAMLNFLTGYRTYIVAAAMLLTGLAGVLGIDIPSFSGQAPGSLVLEALAFFFLRQGLKTTKS